MIPFAVETSVLGNTISSRSPAVHRRARRARHYAKHLLRLAKQVPVQALRGLPAATQSAVAGAAAALLCHHGSTLPSCNWQAMAFRKPHAGFVAIGAGHRSWAHCSACQGWVFHDKMLGDTCRCGARWKQQDLVTASYVQQCSSSLGKGHRKWKGVWSNGNAREVVFGD